MNVAVIPARGGSKRIPHKNVRAFCGRPIIAWSILTALESGLFERVVVSTDDPDIAEVARNWGAETPFERPATLADDYTPTVPVVRHAIEQLEASGHCPDAVCCIYATAPFVTVDDIRRGYGLLREQPADYVVPVAAYDYPIQRSLCIGSEGYVAMAQPEYMQTRSQDLEVMYHDTGQFYWGWTSSWKGERPILGERTLPVVLPSYRVQDIDTPDDWRRAELIFEALRRVDGPEVTEGSVV